MATTKKTAAKNRISEIGNGSVKKGKDVSDAEVKIIASKATKKLNIPPLTKEILTLQLIGDSPLMVNNKFSVALEIADEYDKAGTGKVSKKVKTYDDEYIGAFYIMPSSKHKAPHPKGRYGIPTSGINKCANSAIGQTGITDNKSIGNYRKAFRVISEEKTNGLTEIQFKELQRDIRPVVINRGCPSMRHRPAFYGWTATIKVSFNPLVITMSELVNLFAHAGEYVGLCEMRAEKQQGECGGFNVKPLKLEQVKVSSVIL